MSASSEQNQWVEHVLGFRIAHENGGQDVLKLIDAATLAALTDQAGKLATAPRPSGPPRLQSTNRLLAATGSRPAPEDPMEAPDHVATFLPDFFVAIEQERPATSQQLAAGESWAARTTCWASLICLPRLNGA
jgi:hypothetical protein